VSSRSYLAKSHGDSAIVRASRQTAGSTSSLGSRNTSLRRTGGLAALGSTLSTTEKSSEELTPLAGLLDVVLDTDATRCALVSRWCGTSAHEGTDHDCSIDGTVALSASKRSGFSAGNVAVTDDRSVCLRSTAAMSLSV
jgi:hypothetical protein